MEVFGFFEMSCWYQLRILLLLFLLGQGKGYAPTVLIQCATKMGL